MKTQKVELQKHIKTLASAKAELIRKSDEKEEKMWKAMQRLRDKQTRWK